MVLVAGRCVAAGDGLGWRLGNRPAGRTAWAGLLRQYARKLQHQRRESLFDGPTSPMWVARWHRPATPSASGRRGASSTSSSSITAHAGIAVDGPRWNALIDARPTHVRRRFTSLPSPCLGGDDAGDVVEPASAVLSVNVDTLRPPPQIDPGEAIRLLADDGGIFLSGKFAITCKSMPEFVPAHHCMSPCACDRQRTPRSQAIKVPELKRR